MIGYDYAVLFFFLSSGHRNSEADAAFEKAGMLLRALVMF